MGAKILERIFWTTLGVFIVVPVTYTQAVVHGLRFNVEPSVPIGAYWFTPGPVSRGDIVQSCLPINLARYAVKQHILTTGSCEDSGIMPVIKVLAATGGDVVTVDADTVIVNGKVWPCGTIRRFDSRGRHVDFRLPPGRYRIAADSVFLLGVTPQSWDSRYWGSVPRLTVAGRWTPLLTLPQPQRTST